MFTRTADLYDLIYGSLKDYPAEVEVLRSLVGREGGTLLDVACGTGRHLQELAPHYRAEGLDVDPRMVEIARGRGLAVHSGDLSTFDLGRCFDVVVCLFSSIGYAPDLRAGIANLRRHVAPDGILVVEPWLSPEQVRVGLVGLDSAETETVSVARMSAIEVHGRLSVLPFHYLVGRNGHVEHLTERHELWLWTQEEYAAAFVRAGLRPTYYEVGLMGRGLWLGEPQR